MTAPTVGVALIVRDEAAVIERCLDSFGEQVDQIAVVDTGSRDNTLELVSGWADRHPDVQVVVAEREWDDDFAAARNAADDLLTTDWVSWIDADDELHGAGELRKLAAAAPAGMPGYVMDYDYLQNEAGACVCRLRRERLVRAGAGRWEGRVHEAKPVAGELTLVGPERVEWRHRPDRSAPGASSERNLRILNGWLEDEPDNPRVLVYLGREYATRGDADAAERHFARYFGCEDVHPAEVAQARRHVAVLAMARGDFGAARDHAGEGVKVCPEWPDSYLTLAEIAHHEKEWARAITVASGVLDGGVPETVLIVNPMDYTVQPLTIIASALAGLGRWADAAETAARGLEVDPARPELAQGRTVWASLAERDRLAHNAVDLVQACVAHDEQFAGLGLLDSMPWMIADHPRVVAARRDLRQRVAWALPGGDYRAHYETGGSKPEDAVADGDLDRVCESVSRCGFLLGGLADQAGVELKQAEREGVAA